MANPNIYDLLMGSEPQASEQATAMAEMIRRGRQAQLLGALGSHRAISALGQAAGQQATQDQGLLERAGQARLRFGEEAMDRKASLAQTLEAMRQQGLMTRAAINANKPSPAMDPNKLWIDFGNKFNPGIASSRNPLGVSKGLLNRIERIEAVTEGTKLEDLDRRQMEELGIGVANVMSGGNVAARATIERLVPHTYQGRINEFIESLTNTPTGLDQQDFAKKFLKIMAREKRVATEQMKDTIRQGASTYTDVIRDPRIKDKAQAWFKEAGFNDSEIAGLMGEAPPTAAAPAGPPPATSAAPSGSRFTHPKYPGKFFDAQGNEVQ